MALDTRKDPHQLVELRAGNGRLEEVSVVTEINKLPSERCEGVLDEFPTGHPPSSWFLNKNQHQCPEDPSFPCSLHHTGVSTVRGLWPFPFADTLVPGGEDALAGQLHILPAP